MRRCFCAAYRINQPTGQGSAEQKWQIESIVGLETVLTGVGERWEVKVLIQRINHRKDIDTSGRAPPVTYAVTLIHFPLVYFFRNQFTIWNVLAHYFPIKVELKTIANVGSAATGPLL